MTHPFLFNCDIAGIHADSAERKHFNQTKVRCSLTAAPHLSYLVRFVPIAEHANAGVQVLTHFLLHFHPVIL